MRTPAAIPKPAKAVATSFIAPTAGWIANQALALAGGIPGAARLDNFFPTPTGAMLRRGSVRRYGLSGGVAVQSLFRYVAGGISKLFASTTGPIFDVSESTPTVATSTGTNGNWIAQQFTTAGGTFLIAVNGVDEAWLYDGATWAATAITFPAGSSKTTAHLSYVWSYANRLWFLGKDSMSAWYLPVDQIGGELVEVPLGGVFQRGGVLLFGQSWSVSGGGGLTDQCVFVTTEGEVAAYQGINPADVNSWGQVGLYQIGKPLGEKAFVRAGGDLLIATSIGMVSLTSASQKDIAALGAAAISYPIQEAWADAVRLRGVAGWRCAIWPEGGMLIVAPPLDQNAEPTCFVSNVNTGAWCRFTNWPVASVDVFRGLLHFGDFDGAMWTGNMTGTDNGTPYTGVCIPLHSDMGAPASRKVARHARLIKRSAFPAEEKLTALFNYSTKPPAAPPAREEDPGDVWGAGKWDISVWGTEQGSVVTTDWRSIGGSGQDVSVCVQITSGGIYPLDAELIRIDATVEMAQVIS